MNTQYLEFVRQQLIVATADLSGTTKGQLVAFAENATFTPTARSRTRKKIIHPQTGRLVNPCNPPIPGKQSCPKGTSIALVQPIEYSSSSWRRAVISLENHLKSWLLWNYSENIKFEHQISITRWGWQEFKSRIGEKKVTKKTMERLEKLIWLAAQDTKMELAGLDVYELQKLAELVDVKPSNWSETFSGHWESMKGIYRKMDAEALLAVSRARSQQKAINFHCGVAKLK
ncbi:bacteriophage antitermination protein Q [Entomohabitans teleogrylli]|uniref:bacteriophage antitermination protein Q n=1 Tax=Entomohabitans teleogrylli TaxID=1384589 RepID=UPI00073D93C7|nr:bacteriophage antitermination protein Q [Entomohabitans teleogrylli]